MLLGYHAGKNSPVLALGPLGTPHPLTEGGLYFRFIRLIRNMIACNFYESSLGILSDRKQLFKNSKNRVGGSVKQEIKKQENVELMCCLMDKTIQLCRGFGQDGR